MSFSSLRSRTASTAGSRCFFDYDPEVFRHADRRVAGDNGAFAECLKQLGHPPTSPADFIRSCSQIYQNSAPQVLTRGDVGQISSSLRRFARGPLPSTLRAKSTSSARWVSKDQPAQICGEYFLERKDMFTHVLDLAPLGETADEEGRYPNEEKTFRCLWKDCSRHDKPTSLRLIDFARHVNVHISSCWPPPTSEPRTKKPRKDWMVPAKTMTVTFEETQTVRDEQNPNAPAQASGIPLSAVLVLRNIARNVGKTDAEEELAAENERERGGEPGGWKERLFRPLMGRLFEVMAENRAMVSLLCAGCQEGFGS